MGYGRMERETLFKRINIIHPINIHRFVFSGAFLWLGNGMFYPIHIREDLALLLRLYGRHNASKETPRYMGKYTAYFYKETITCVHNYRDVL